MTIFKAKDSKTYCFTFTIKSLRSSETPEGKRPFGKPRRRWRDNIKVDFQEVGYEGMDCIDLAEDRDRWRARVNAVMKFRLP
jgi:hypothetical protein